METLVVVASQHKHQYYPGKSRSQDLTGLNSSPSSKFREMNCRTFYAVEGILPTPDRASSIPVNLKTPACPRSAEPVRSKPAQKSSPISIAAKPISSKKFSDDGFVGERLFFSERWAGPTYSNSPPPSSLPMPMFLQLPKRTKSLDLPDVVSSNDASVHPISKSAPASPVRGFSPLFSSKDSATMTLCRILNLELSDE